MDFVQQFKWSNLTNYNTNEHKAFENPADGQTDTFVKAHDRFKFYWILRAGHAVSEVFHSFVRVSPPIPIITFLSAFFPV